MRALSLGSAGAFWADPAGDDAGGDAGFIGAALEIGQHGAP